MHPLRPASAPLPLAAHEFQYNPQRAFPAFAAHQQRREPINRLALDWPGRDVDLSYGSAPLQTVDFYPAAPARARPTAHLYLHGGYWRQQDKANYAFIGAALAARGIPTIVANYPLCPAVTLDAVVDSALAFFAWTCAALPAFGATRLTLSGHSAGAHLVAEILATDWTARGLAAPPVAGATLISGIFDPRPAIRTTVNIEIGLDDAMAARHDVEATPPRVDCPVSIIVGGREPVLWIDQSLRYGLNLHQHGIDAAIHVVPGRDHFDIIDGYLDDDSALLRDLLAMAAGRPLPG